MNQQLDGSVDNDGEARQPQGKRVLAEQLIRLARLGGLASVLITVVTFAARYFWFADLMANLRMQQLIAIVFAFAVATLARQYRLMGLIFLCVGVHLSCMLPQLLPADKADVALVDPIRLMTVNVLTNNSAHDEIVAEIMQVNPDVVAVVELSTDLQRHLSGAFSQVYPYSETRGQDLGNFGIGLYSKEPLSEVKVFQLNEAIDSIEASCRGYRLIATHPLPPMGHRNFRSRNEHFALLVARILQFRERDPTSPLAVMGDFNLTPWSPHFRDLESLSGLHRARQGFAITPTWYARTDYFPFGLVLDHVLVSESLRCDQYRVGPNVGSDHRSVTVRVGTAVD